jgi:hypothetical protein
MFNTIKIWLVKFLVSSVAARIDANSVIFLAFDVVMKYEDAYGTEARDTMFSLMRGILEDNDEEE